MVTLTFSVIKHVTLSTTCPKCGRETATDKGHCLIENLESVQGFWCEDCGDFEATVDWGSLLNKAIEAATDAS